MKLGASREKWYLTQRIAGTYLKFDNSTLIHEDLSAMNTVGAIENLERDFRYALRHLLRNPSFALLAIFTLAVGIGANIVVFSVLNGLLFSSLHIHDASRIVALGFRQKEASWQASFSYLDYLDLRNQTKKVFSSVIADQYGLDGFSTHGSQPDRIFTDYVSGNYFKTLGIQPALGRLFEPSEGQTPGADSVIVLSYAYWRQHFGGERSIVGRHVNLNGHPLTIIGVTPRNYHGISSIFSVQAYIPLAMVVPLENIPITDWNKLTTRNIHIYARVKGNLNIQQSNAALAIVGRQLAETNPLTEKNAEVRAFPLYLARNGGIDPQNTIGIVAALFFALTGLVLLLACVNVVNLLLVRASAREHEMVIRAALGAQRSRLIRQILTESILLAFIAGVVGIGLGWIGTQLLGLINLQTDIPLFLRFPFDTHVFAFSMAVALPTGVIVGIVPAVRLSRTNLNTALRLGGRGVVGGRGRFRDFLVMLQIGGAFVMLIVAGLFVRSLSMAQHITLGFNPNNVVTLNMDPSEIGYADKQSRDFYERLLERVRVLPGVESATVAAAIPMGTIDNGSTSMLTIVGRESQTGEAAQSVGYNIIGTDYFKTLQIPLLRGRGFTEADNNKSPYVAVVSESMAKQFWPNEEVIGKQFIMSDDPSHTLRVIGIAGNARYTGLTGPIGPYFYLPFLQHYSQNSLEALEVRTVRGPLSVLPDIEQLVRNMAPSLPLFSIQTLNQSLYSPNGFLIFKIAASAAGITGLLGLALAAIGIYGVHSYVVSQKTTEIGLRMALGAQRFDILKIVYRQGMYIVGIGLILGIAVSLMVAHLLRSVILVSPTDTETYLGVSSVLILISMIACYIPARRAMLVEPMQALQGE